MVAVATAVMEVAWAARGEEMEAGGGSGGGDGERRARWRRNLHQRRRAVNASAARECVKNRGTGSCLGYQFVFATCITSASHHIN